MTVSHLRYGPDPIQSTYLVDDADLVACHQFGLLDRFDVLSTAPPGCDAAAEHSVRRSTRSGSTCRRQHAHRSSIGAEGLRRRRGAIASELGIGGRINTVMQACFFALADVIPLDEAVTAMKRLDRARVRPPRPLDRRAQPRCDRPGPRGDDAARRAVRAGDEADVDRAGDPGRRRLRGAGDRGADRRARRSAARVGDADRRHVPDRHVAPREAQARRRDPDLGARSVHRLRQVRRSSARTRRSG